jgi:hypothetical protein
MISAIGGMIGKGVLRSQKPGARSQLAHAGDHGDLEGLAGGDEALQQVFASWEVD